MIMKAADDIEGEVAGTALSEIGQALEEAAQACSQVVTNRYPFDPKSDRDVPLSDFARIFAPGGVLDGFFSEHLARLVDTSGPQWTSKQDSQVARGVSAGTLRQFQRAAEIRDAFFPNGGSTPSVMINITPLTVTGADSAVFKINATTIETLPMGNPSTPVEWPGPNPENYAAIAAKSGMFENVSLLERRGPWALFRLLESGATRMQGDSIVATFTVEGGAEASYQFDVSSIKNPLRLQALRDFRCPEGL
jgi:type VI secretion system protein ImpL